MRPLSGAIDALMRPPMRACEELRGSARARGGEGRRVEGVETGGLDENDSLSAPCSKLLHLVPTWSVRPCSLLQAAPRSYRTWSMEQEQIIRWNGQKLPTPARCIILNGRLGRYARHAKRLISKGIRARIRLLGAFRAQERPPSPKRAATFLAPASPIDFF